jgi:hypothetical protein
MQYPRASVRVANSLEALERVLLDVENGRRPAPDWIHIQGRCDLGALSESEQERLLRRLHPCVLRGFRLRPTHDADSYPAVRLALWRRIARHGFHDFGTQGFSKCYASPFIEDHDYVRGYLEGGLAGLDPYRVYSAVLGTHDYSVEDFLQTPSCEKIDTVVEPMAGTAEFTYHSHFRHPELRYLLVDLDKDARDAVLARPWLESCQPHYAVRNVLDPETWRQLGHRITGRSLAYIGKQSHNLFDARELYELLALGTSTVDYFVLETPEPALVSDLAAVDDLTRPEMKDAGFQAALVEDEASPPNPFTNELGFRMEVWDESERRVLFEYPSWRAWQPPTLVALAELLDLDVSYLNESAGDFLPVEDCQVSRAHGDHQPQHIDHSEAHDSVGFMLFRRRS